MVHAERSIAEVDRRPRECCKRQNARPTNDIYDRESPEQVLRKAGQVPTMLTNILLREAPLPWMEAHMFQTLELRNSLRGLAIIRKFAKTLFTPHFKTRIN